MTKETTKTRILTEGAQIVHRKGFSNTGIQEILQAAGVPKGSFYFYFKSKEEFGLALIDFYFGMFAQKMEVLRSSELTPLKRLREFFHSFLSFFEQRCFTVGCPIGTLTQEMGSLGEAFQPRLKKAFERMRAGIGTCLEEAKAAGELDESVDPYEMADFVVNSWEGALLRMKAEKSPDPLLLFDRVVFDQVLKR